jgi:hypothetical protein
MLFLNGTPPILYAGLGFNRSREAIERLSMATHNAVPSRTIMRRFRNPRYAPELLERRLSPSATAPPPADVSTTDTGTTDTSVDMTTADTTDPNIAPGTMDDMTTADTSSDPDPAPGTTDEMTGTADTSDPAPDPAPGDIPPDDPDPPADPGGPGYDDADADADYAYV